jgi:GNAT superfamily N-acetyltransferase
VKPDAGARAIAYPVVMRTPPVRGATSTSSTTTRIRRAHIGDAQRLAWIRTASWRDAYADLIGLRTLEEMNRHDGDRMLRAVQQQREGRRVWIAEDEHGTAMGYAWSGPQTDRRVVAGGRSCLGEVYELYLHPQWQRRGIGSQLLVHAIWRLVDAGLNPPMLWVLGGNGARRFYEGTGAVEFASRPIVIGGRALDEVAYGWHEQLPLP